MSKLFFSKLRIFILIILSVCISFNTVAMATEISQSEAPAISSHCMSMMGDTQVSNPDSLPSGHHEQNTCVNHDACFGLELKSVDLSMSVTPTIAHTTQTQSPYKNLITLGYFALPDPPPRYTLQEHLPEHLS